LPTSATVRLQNTRIKRIVILTGDNEGSARATAAQTGLDEYPAEMMPKDKVEAIRQLKQKYGKIAMVGGGVNDAPAIAAADEGIAMGAAGTESAMGTADLALMSDDL
jgi:Cd2+/Zn2+-exporting ATPase